MTGFAKMSQSCLEFQTFVCYTFPMLVDKSVMQKVVSYLKQLGFSTEEAAVYLYLLEHGPSSVLAISRGISSGRTKLYPLLEELTAKQLVITHERHYGTSYEAQSPSALEFLVLERERKADGLRKNLPAVLSALSGLQTDSPSTSRVAEYHGVDGLKQMNFNLTKADGEYRVFELSGLDKHLGKHFADKMRDITKDKKTKSYDLTNNPRRTAEPGTDNTNAAVRYIEPNVFTIEFETYIYNNCVALLSYNRDDIFGVELYNDKLARQQTQLFDLLWRQAQPLK
jgi:sugar-specific transcriptional regulator TrmB